MTMTMKEDDDLFTWGNSVSKFGPDDQRRKPGLRFSSFDHSHDDDDDADYEDDEDEEDDADYEDDEDDAYVISYEASQSDCFGTLAWTE